MIISTEVLDYVVQVNGIECIIDVTSAPYREELFRLYYDEICKNDNSTSGLAA